MWLYLAFLFVLNVLSAVSQKSCMTPNRETALCIPIRSCKIFYDYIRESGRDQERNDYMVASKCGADRNGPLVCCGSDIKFKTTLPDRSECGLQDSLRVLGGEDTDIGEFPWMALLQQTRETGTKIWGCGGSLISHKYVLTAAHCVVSSKSKVTLVRVGEWNLDTSEDCVGKGTYKSCSLPPQDIAVEATTPHPDYVKNNNAVVNDIALIRLAKPVVFNKYVLPICLPLPEERSAAGERSYVSGWGAVSESKSSSAKKQKLKVPIVDLNVCIDKYGKAGYRITTKMICAGGEKGKDSCKGDSGGPLITNTTSANEQFYVEGIVSFGARCGTEGFPAIYTKVTDFLDWIKENVKP